MEHSKCKWTKIRIEFNHIDTLITSDESEKSLKLIKYGKNPGEDNINSEIYKYKPEEFKLRLPQFLNNIHTKNCNPSERRSTVAIQLLKKGDRRDPKNYRGISILSTCCKIYSKILNIKL